MNINNNTNSIEDQLIFELIDKMESKKTKAFLQICDVGYYKTDFYKNDDGTYNIEFYSDKTISADCLFNKDLLLRIEDSKIIVNSCRILSIHEEFHFGKEIKVIATVDAFDSLSSIEFLNDAKQIAFCEIKEKEFSYQQIGVILDATTSHYDDEIWNDCMEIIVDEYAFLLYFIKTKEQLNYLVLKSQTKICRNQFLNVLESIRISIGLLSGQYIADCVWYFSKYPDATELLAYNYENMAKSLNNRHPIIDSNRYKNYLENEHKLSAIQFNNLVNLLCHSKEIRRSTFLLIQASALNNISKGCLASVALETIKDNIIKTESNTLLEDDTIKLIIKDLITTLNKYKDSVEEKKYSRIEGELSHLGQPSNAEALRQPFITLGIKLDKEEMHCIESRNDFLHGREVKTKKNLLFNRLSYSELENTISNKLIMLCAALILKKCGYKGKIIDWGYTELTKHRAMYAKQSKCEEGSYFRDI